MAAHRARTDSDNFIESVDPGLLVYKEELYSRAVTSEETLRYLRPREVREMNLPEVYKRMLIDKIVNLQTPESKSKMKTEAESPASVNAPKPKKVKRLFESDNIDINSNVAGDNISCTDDQSQTNRPTYDDKASSGDKNFLDNELDKLKDERESLTILMVHKKNLLKDMRVVPEPLCPVAIPGGLLTKTVCDNCHHRGHKYKGNRGGQACPFDRCEGYEYCGILQKHKEYKSIIQEAEKEVSALEKDVRMNEEKINSLQVFLQTNNTNFVKMIKPRLQIAFPKQYIGKDGNQMLQKDIRFIKLATQGKIPGNITSISPSELEKLIKSGQRLVSTKFKLDEAPVCLSETVSRGNTQHGTYSFTTPQPAPQMYPYWSGMYPYSTGPYPGMWYGSPVSQPHALTSPCTVSKSPDAEKEIFPPLPTEEYPQPPLPPKKCDD